jgi:hypothetical protein
MVEDAKDALTRLAAGKEVELRYGGTKTNRQRLCACAGLPRGWREAAVASAGAGG